MQAYMGILYRHLKNTIYKPASQQASKPASQPASKQAAATSICPLERMIKYYKYSKLPQYRNETFSRHTAP
jgi:uncharacterized membrane protein YgaE (UPF0421/DUF939 family)